MPLGCRKQLAPEPHAACPLECVAGSREIITNHRLGNLSLRFTLLPQGVQISGASR